MVSTFDTFSDLRFLLSVLVVKVSNKIVLERTLLCLVSFSIFLEIIKISETCRIPGE